MIQFYAPDIAVNPVLPEAEAAHCIRVLRMKEGDEIFVTDGKGYRYSCLIDKVNRSEVLVNIVEKIAISEPRNYQLTVAIAPPKNSDRLEWFIEKAVEIGIDRIVLLKCRHNERKIQKTDRLLKIAVSAMKQSLSSYVPEITELIDFKEYIPSVDKNAQKFFGYCSPLFPKKEFVKVIAPGGEVVVLIGPEGDFSEEEVEMAVSEGFNPVTFGKKRLRTETAGVFAVCAVNVINQIND